MLLTALLLDFFMVSIVPASTGADTQDALVGFFLPSLSCSLGLWVHAVPMALENIPYLQSLRERRRLAGQNLPDDGLPYVENRRDR